MSIKEELYKEVAKMESEIKKDENPIQANPPNIRNPNYDLEAADNIPDDKEPDKLMVEIEALETELEGGPGSGKKGSGDEDEPGISEDEKKDRIYKRVFGPGSKPSIVNGSEAAKPYQAPQRKPQKSDNMESPDGIAIMNEIDAIAKRLDAQVPAQEPAPADNPLPDEKEECDAADSPRKKYSKSELDGEDAPKKDMPKPGVAPNIPTPAPKMPEDPKESLSVKEYLGKSKEFTHQVR